MADPPRAVASPSARAEPRPGRPLRATALALFCASTVVFLMARDLWVPEVRDVEVWFGFELRGGLARWSAPLHWGLFAAAAWAFWTQRSWIWPGASVYAVYVAASHLVWNLTSPSGSGLVAGLWQGAGFGLVAVVLLWARPREPAG